jgi:hypothetical protein
MAAVVEHLVSKAINDCYFRHASRYLIYAYGRCIAALCSRPLWPSASPSRTKCNSAISSHPCHIRTLRLLVILSFRQSLLIFQIVSHTHTARRRFAIARHRAELI